MTGQDIITEARSWLGVRWCHQGRTREGVDCIGLIGAVALALGAPGATQWRDTPAFHSYGRQPDPKVLMAGCELLLDRITTPVVGDIVVMRFRLYPQHFGFFTGNSLIHAYAQARKVVENGVDEKWGARIVSTWRLRGING
jgi:cell wall-associated NlpC family hydrolase